MKPKTDTKPATELGTLLGTEDTGQHPARVRELIQVAQAPVLTLLMQHDPRAGRTTIQAVDSAGAPLSFDVAHKLLDAARKVLTEQQVRAEAEAQAAKAATEVKEKIATELSEKLDRLQEQEDRVTAKAGIHVMPIK